VESPERFFLHAGRDEPRYERRALQGVNATAVPVDLRFDERLVEFTVRVGRVAEAPVKISKKADATFFASLVGDHGLPHLHRVLDIHEDRFSKRIPWSLDVKTE